ncbi:hypothetical protein GE21DRAFT_1061241 [Neurospora crassa]|nr:hypothetical protein GE21DRAFT_1061241 [Neurospora crassa]
MPTSLALFTTISFFIVSSFFPFFFVFSFFSFSFCSFSRCTCEKKLKKHVISDDNLTMYRNNNLPPRPDLSTHG